MEHRFSSHALEEIKKRQIPIELVEKILQNPQQILEQDEQIQIYQSKFTFNTNKTYLLRIFINIQVEPKVIVTVYRTSKISKYWSTL
ncbi:MAG: DUF4258 domain-containing protein [Synechococcaceae cyanobacterium RL_1_2]|nr:DUF4258 domain-containing protein [Synechococcaceae cyanobacterium RL_1_2]